MTLQERGGERDRGETSIETDTDRERERERQKASQRERTSQREIERDRKKAKEKERQREREREIERGRQKQRETARFLRWHILGIMRSGSARALDFRGLNDAPATFHEQLNSNPKES